MNSEKLFKSPEESENSYILRICEAKLTKELDATWEDVANIINNQLGYNYSESYYRKGYKAGLFGLYFNPKHVTSGFIQVDGDFHIPEVSSITTSAQSAADGEEVDCDGDCGNCDLLPECMNEYRDSLLKKEIELNDTLTEIQKERMKTSDVMTQNRAYLRRISREETIKEIAFNYAEKMNANLRLPAPVAKDWSIEGEEEKEGILLLSDWHYGMVCDNSWNKFDPDICKQRVFNLMNQVIKRIKKEGIRKVTVLNLSDLIAGRIHTQIRIESRFDVITQTMEVSEILAEFLNQLSLHCEVDFYDCLDNHSRLEPNKNDSMDLESLVRIIPWYLTTRLSDNDRIHIKDNEFGLDIITCKVLGHDIIAVHGDHDSPVTGIDKLTLMTHRHYDLFCTAHRHHFQMDEKNHCLVVGNSSLMGTDSYAEKLRLSSEPSQTLIVVTKDNVCDGIYRILVK